MFVLDSCTEGRPFDAAYPQKQVLLGTKDFSGLAPHERLYAILDGDAISIYVEGFDVCVSAGGEPSVKWNGHVLLAYGCHRTLIQDGVATFILEIDDVQLVCVYVDR